MQNKLLFSLSVALLSISMVSAQQQWNGDNNTTSEISRTGKVSIGNLLFRSASDNQFVIENKGANNLYLRSVALGNSTPGHLILNENMGNVGIGTTGPKEKLQVVGNTQSSGFLTSSVSGGYYGFGIKNSGTNWVATISGQTGAFIRNQTNSRLQFFTTTAATENEGIVTISERMSILHSNGFVGIGDPSPSDKLTVSGGNLRVNGNITATSDITGYNINVGRRLYFNNAQDNGIILLGRNQGENRVHITHTGSHGIFNFKDNLYFSTDQPWVYPLILQGDGTVAIGFTATTGTGAYDAPVGYRYATSANFAYKLAVNGAILCEEIKVITDVPNSDHVFKDSYNLRSLAEVEQFVKEHKHLPEVPSALEFKTNGYSVGTMDDLLLRKVEELTLYIIQQQKEIDALKELVNGTK